jgi:hypothetical protein
MSKVATPPFSRRSFSKNLPSDDDESFIDLSSSNSDDGMFSESGTKRDLPLDTIPKKKAKTSKLSRLLISYGYCGNHNTSRDHLTIGT